MVGKYDVEATTQQVHTAGIEVWLYDNCELQDIALILYQVFARW